ncbi:hypothetical protein D3870_20825 [Noviherbaspirillum cavernae]|uniref:Uncharacterized protein n=1 Tax=Noviherbaspirillum cavernae TaxID=2320862 RepID=A0A418WW48_9BURK|nr:hypothetical protein D3870_20825 [Noviherbaspirillum cavernae]
MAGFPIASDANVAHSFLAAQHSAQDDFQTALSVLKESLAWRKHGSLTRGSLTCARIRQAIGWSRLVVQATTSTTRIPSMRNSSFPSR